MSKLISGLKNNLNFDKRVDIYVPSELKNDFRIKDLKKRYGTSSFNTTIKNAILFYVYLNLDFDKELFEQIKYNQVVTQFFKNQENFEETTTLKKFKESFLEIKVLNWHMIFCLSNLFKYTNQIDINNSYEIYDKIIDFNYVSEIPRVHDKKKYTFTVNILSKKDFKKLKILHGTSNMSSTLKKCILFYAYTMLNKKTDFQSKKNYIDHHEDKKLESDSEKKYLIELPVWVEGFIDLELDNYKDISDILIFNMQIYHNLFPEQR